MSNAGQTDGNNVGQISYYDIFDLDDVQCTRKEAGISM